MKLFYSPVISITDIDYYECRVVPSNNVPLTFLIIHFQFYFNLQMTNIVNTKH